MAISAFPITGNPGSGKTTIARELSRRGLIAVDADETAHWETTAGAPGHRWVWSRRRIEDVIRPHAQILDRRATFEREMRAAGAVVLDGSRPTGDLVSQIHHEVSGTNGPRP